MSKALRRIDFERLQDLARDVYNDPARLGNLSLLIGSALLIVISSVLLISSVSFALGYSISGVEIYFAIFISVLWIAWSAHQYFKDSALMVFVAILLFLAALSWTSLFVSGNLYDLSYDGQVYHQEAIIQLAEGWNPFYKNIVPAISSHHLWMNSYPKGPWVLAAALYKITGHIEQGKCFNLMFILISFFISLSALLNFSRIKVGMAVLLSCLLSMNPVSICQSLSFYVDGQLSSMLITLGSLLYLLSKSWDRLRILTAALSMIVVINLKFTGIVYPSIIISGVLFYFWFCGRKKLSLNMISLFAASGFVGMLLVGYSPYVNNILRHGHPFYPLAGRGSVDILRYNMPGSFLEMNRFESLLVSVFSKSENTAETATHELKWPFTLYRTELEAFYIPDARVGGWGPLFGGGVAISFLIFLLAIKSDFRKAMMAAGAVLVIFVSVIINPGSWWARYSPQLWLIPIIFILLSEYLRDKFAYVLKYFVIFALILNVLLVTGSYLEGQYGGSLALKNQLIGLRTQQDSPVLISFEDFRSNRIRLKEMGINYLEMKELECPEYMPLIFSDTKLCIKKP